MGAGLAELVPVRRRFFATRTEVRLADLEGFSAEVAAWAERQPPGP